MQFGSSYLLSLPNLHCHLLQPSYQKFTIPEPQSNQNPISEIHSNQNPYLIPNFYNPNFPNFEWQNQPEIQKALGCVNWGKEGKKKKEIFFFNSRNSTFGIAIPKRKKDSVEDVERSGGLDLLAPSVEENVRNIEEEAKEDTINEV